MLFQDCQCLRLRSRRHFQGVGGVPEAGAQHNHGLDQEHDDLDGPPDGGPVPRKFLMASFAQIIAFVEES